MVPFLIALPGPDGLLSSLFPRYIDVGLTWSEDGSNAALTFRE